MLKQNHNILLNVYNIKSKDAHFEGCNPQIETHLVSLKPHNI